MMDLELNVQYQLRLLLMLTLFCSALNMNIWTVSPDSNKILKYMVLVTRHWPTKNKTQPGILLNDNYVLTNYGYIFHGKAPRENYSVLIDYYGKNESEMKGKEYKIGYIQYYHSLVLLKTHKIEFGPNVGCLKLPSELNADTWKFPSSVPNNVEVISSCWGKNLTGHRVLHVRKGIRYCAWNILWATPKHLIPTCLVKNQTKTSDRPAIRPDCFVDEGIALVYNNTLMGIRTYSGESAPKKYNTSFNYDLFHNVAFYWDWLQDVMMFHTPCEPISK